MSGNGQQTDSQSSILQGHKGTQVERSTPRAKL
jgi:hypothetical protein